MEQVNSFESKAWGFQEAFKCNLAKIANDSKGNPRYVIFALNLAKDFNTAAKLARKIGGRVYTGSGYAMSMAFATNNPEELAKKIATLFCDVEWFNEEYDMYSKAECWQGLARIS